MTTLNDYRCDRYVEWCRLYIFTLRPVYLYYLERGTLYSAIAAVLINKYNYLIMHIHVIYMCIYVDRIYSNLVW